MASYGRVPVYSNAYKLFNMFWLCLVPANEMMNVNDFEYFGVAMTGNRVHDERLATAMVEKNISPAEMAQLIADGVPVTLVDPSDSIPIYQLILAHLQEWLEHLDNDNGMYELVIPLEGLKEFNVLASILVPLASNHGLVDEFSKKKKSNPNKVERWGSITAKKIFQAKDARHSQSIFDQICNHASKRGYFVKGRAYQTPGMDRSSDGSMSADKLYGK